MISMRDDIPEEDMPPRIRFVFTTPSPGYDVAESSVAATARAPRGQYDFVDTVEAGIPLMNADEFLEMDPYKKVSQQGQVYPLSPAYLPDPMKLDEHVPIYVPKPEHPEYHAPSDDDIE
nr:hypothetical protein [Tanacetum cinerariifolium]